MSAGSICLGPTVFVFAKKVWRVELGSCKGEGLFGLGETWEKQLQRAEKGKGGDYYRADLN